MKKIALLVFATMVWIPDIFAQRVPDDIQLRALDQFNAGFEAPAVLQWNRKTGAPGILYGFRSRAYPSKSTPESVARQFLEENHSLLKTRPGLPDLTLIRSRTDERVHHLDFQQTYDGLVVLGAEYSVAVGEDKTVHMVAGYYYPDFELSTDPVLSAAGAEDLAAAALEQSKSELGPLSTSLVVLPRESDFLLAYKVQTTDWEVLVNASTGAIESKGNRRMHISSAMQFERTAPFGSNLGADRPIDEPSDPLLTTGQANVYQKDPVNSSIAEVTLYRLNGSGYLDGSYVKVLKYSGSPAFSSTNDFRHTPPTYTQADNTHFDEANVYLNRPGFFGDCFS